MKKTNIALFLCLLMVFGAITVIYSDSVLKQAWQDAEIALQAEIIRMEPLRTKLNTLIERQNTLSGGKWKQIFSLLNPVDIAKTLLLDAGTIQKLFDLDAAIIAAQIELEPLQANLAMLESARDAAYDKYVATLSPSEEKPGKEIPKYVEIKEYRAECRNSCGTIFSSKVVGLGNLKSAAERSHLVLCPDEPHKSRKFGYYSCPPYYPKVCPQASEHGKPLAKMTCRGPCGKEVPNLLGKPDDSSHRQGCMEKSWHREPIRIKGEDYIRMYVDDCPQGEYYHCKIGLPCPNAKNHVKSRDSREDKYVDSQGTAVNPSTVKRDCGHSLSASGDHTRQASCSEDANCISTNFYKCQHTHEYAKASASLSGSGSASAGSTYTVTLTTPQAFSKLYWYVAAPGESGFGTLKTTMTGGSSSTTASYSYRIPSSTSAGDYVITAFYYKNSDGVASYVHHTVSVSANLMACGHAKGTPGSHTYVRCPRAKDGARCRADQKHPGYHLACDTSHVHQYGPLPTTPVSKPKDTPPTDTTPTPTTPKKENPPLTTPTDTPPTDTTPKDTTPKETTPKPKPRPTATCSAGHTYYTNSSYARKRHRDRTCTRCSLTYQNCTNHGTACQNSKWHTEDPSAAPKSPTTPTPTTPTPTTPTPTTPTPTTPSPTTPVPQAPSQVTYHACGIHKSSVSGDHSLQASCSETNSNGDYCTVTSFYACQSHTHQYPAPPPKKPDPPPPPKSACPADSWSNCGGSSSHAATCSAGHSYYTCASQAWHKDRTCTRCSQTYQDCTNSSSACQSNHWHTDQAIAKIKCGASGWTSCTTSVSSKTEHRRTCRENHQYWTCGTAVEWHKTRTCTRCGWAYSKCGNSATACQGKRWHTGG